MLRDLYGSAILFVYYLKIPIVLGWPLLRIVYEYKDNYIIDLLWLLMAGAIMLDIYKVVRKKP